MAKMLFTISKGMDSGLMVSRAFHFAKVAKEKGHDVTIFLLEDGVYWAQFGMTDDFITNQGNHEGAGGLSVAKRRHLLCLQGLRRQKTSRSGRVYHRL